MSSRLDRAAAAAAREVTRMLGNEHLLAAFKVEKFGEHANGYLHARVSLNGERFYVHRRWGSWTMPGHIGNKSIEKEVLSPFRDRLQEHARPYDQQARREREERDARERTASKSANTAGDNEAPADAGVPEAGDSDGAERAVPA